MDLSNCTATKNAIDFSQAMISGNPYLKGQELLDEIANLAKLKKEYASMGCGVDLVKDDCASLDDRITSLTNLISTQGFLAIKDNTIYPYIDSLKKQLAELKSQYNSKGCVVKVEEIKQATVQEVAKVYEDLSKVRIETTSVYERNKRLFFGAIVLLLALALVSTNKKE